MGEYINSRQARFDKSHVSCGVIEVHHLPDDSAINTVFAVANNLFHKTNGRPAAFVLFSDVVDKREQRGQALADQLKKMDMGILFESSKAINPRSGNTIRVWLWQFDAEKFRKWYTEEYANRVVERD